ncbi:MAG TPA: LPS assembly protein LptD [Methylococcaceae bacterium]|nr:LPS assembly protein LptD [Methylococcaceae bacterium]
MQAPHSRGFRPGAYGSLLLVCCAWLMLLPAAQAATRHWDCQQVDGKYVCNVQKPVAATGETEAATKPPASESADKTSAPEEQAEESAGEASPENVSPGRKGWSCAAGSGKKGWNCALSGPDPRRKPLPSKPSEAVAEGRAAASGASTITGADELRFRSMMSVLPNDPWGMNCAAPPPGADDGISREERESIPMDITSDYAEMVDNEISTFVGSVDMQRADQRLLGDFVSHDKVSNTLHAKGNVIYRENDTTIGSDSAFLKLDSGVGTLRNSQFIFEKMPSRGTARVSHFDSKTFSRYESVTYTSCRPGNQDWLLHASTLKIDKETGRGAARHAWLEFKGVPFLYTPYLSFPIDNRRMSGFLTPSFSTASRTGFSLTAPYYWNIAPNYDATFYPRYMTKRGPLLGAEFRYLTEMSKGSVQGEIVPNDFERDQMRGSFQFTDRTTFTPNLSSNLRLDYVSDNNYVYELGNTLDFSNKVYLHSFGNLNFIDKFNDLTVSSTAYVSNYQVLDETIPDSQKPYRQLPQVNLNLSHPLGLANGVASVSNEYVYWDHSDNVTGSRVNIKPRLTFPWETTWGFLKPSLSVQHTQYWLSNLDKQPAGFDFASSVGRTTPIFSTDSGLFFERDTNWFGTPMSQTLEPRLFYLYVPHQDQEDIPVFAASPYDFTFYQLFRENRFTGVDRMGDANQVSVALTSRLIDQSTGKERFRGSIGKIFEIQAQRTELLVGDVLTANNTALLGTQFSRSANAFNTIDQNDVIADFSAALTDTLTFNPLVIWNYQENHADRLQANLQYHDGRNRLLNLGYRHRRDLLELTDASARFPIVKDWYAVGRWQYSLLHDTTLDSFVGFEKESCCWRFSLLGRRWVNNLSGDPAQSVNDSDVNTGIFLQVELKGLTRFGDQVDRFLEKSISGYERPGR